MTDNECKLFETNLVKKYETDPNAELAEVLIKEYSAHKFNNTLCTDQLQSWMDERKNKLSKDNKNLNIAFDLIEKWGRSKSDLKYICMNVQIWKSIYYGSSISSAYQETANIFSSTIEDVKIGFERKNHDFGTRELSRFSLDIFVAIYDKHLTDEETIKFSNILREDVSVQRLKDLGHHRIKYKNIL